MSYTAQPAVPPLTVTQLSEVAELSDEARAIYQSEQGHREYLAALVEGEQYADAVQFLAHALPRREAIWWAWSSARRLLDEAPPPETQAALDATQRWIAEPTDAHRRAAFEVAEPAGVGTPAGCAALAVFFSGGSVAPAEAEAVPPPPYAAAKAIAGSIILAAAAVEPKRAPELFPEFIAKGLELATRLQLWLAP